MAATPFPGKSAYVTLPRGRYTFDSYTLAVTTDKVDATDFDRVAARWLPGAAAATAVFVGPLTYDSGLGFPLLGLLPGNEYVVYLGLSSDVAGDLYVGVVVQVETARVVQRAGDVARVEVAGTVNSDFLIESSVVYLFDEEHRGVSAT